MTIHRRSLLAASVSSIGWLASGLPVPAWAQGAKVLNVALFPEPNALMIGAGSTGPAQMVMGSVYESLLRYDDKLKPLTARE